MKEKIIYEKKVSNNNKCNNGLVNNDNCFVGKKC